MTVKIWSGTLAVIAVAGFAGTKEAPHNRAAILPITINPAKTYQHISGFGGAMTQTAAYLFEKRMSAAERHKALESLFSRQHGIGLNYIRLPMGASDFSMQRYTYDDMPKGRTDYLMKHFSIARDRAFIIPVLKEILKINPRVRILATPWTPPAWMKSAYTLAGVKHNKVVSLQKSGRMEHAYALYFAKFIKAYAAAGIKINAITPQNEPWNMQMSYPTSGLSPRQEGRAVVDLGKLFKREGIGTHILIWDHNWNNFQYALDILKNARERRYVWGTAFHCYGGQVADQARVHAAFPGKRIYFTECSGGSWNRNFARNLVWNAQNLLIGGTRNWTKTVILFNFVLDRRHGPKLPGGCANCRGILTVIGNTGLFKKNVEYYALGQMSRFIPRGSVRIASGGKNTVAFKTPAGAIVLVVVNPNNNPEHAQVKYLGHALGCQLPAKSLNTLVWSAKSPAVVNICSTSGTRADLFKELPAVHF